MKIALCGSTKFMDSFNEANGELTLAGHIVYSVALSSHGNMPMNESDKITLDLVHLRKIMESDCVVVVGGQPDGSTYVGESTRRELQWARINDRQVFFWNRQREKLLGSWSPRRTFLDAINEASNS